MSGADGFSATFLVVVGLVFYGFKHLKDGFGLCHAGLWR